MSHVDEGELAIVNVLHPRAPKGKNRLPTIHFQWRAVKLWGCRLGIQKEVQIFVMLLVIIESWLMSTPKYTVFSHFHTESVHNVGELGENRAPFFLQQISSQLMVN